MTRVPDHNDSNDEISGLHLSNKYHSALPHPILTVSMIIRTSWICCDNAIRCFINGVVRKQSTEAICDNNSNRHEKDDVANAALVAGIDEVSSFFHLSMVSLILHIQTTITTTIHVDVVYTRESCLELSVEYCGKNAVTTVLQCERPLLEVTQLTIDIYNTYVRKEERFRETDSANIL